MKKNGFTFIELIVVVFLILTITAFVFYSAEKDADIQKLKVKAEELGSQFVKLSTAARSSQSSMRLTCSSSRIVAYKKRVARSVCFQNSAICTGAANQVSGSGITTEIVNDQTNSNISIRCPNPSNIYITSEGSIINQNNQTQPVDIIFYAANDTNLEAKLSMYSTGIYRVFLMDKKLKNTFNEVTY